MSRGTPVAPLMFVGPCIEVKAVKGYALRADRNDGDPGTHLAVEAVFVHAEIGRCIAEPDESGSRASGMSGIRTVSRLARPCMAGSLGNFTDTRLTVV